MNLETIPLWFWISSAIAAILYAFAKKYQGKCLFWGTLLEAIVVFAFIFIIQQSITQILNSKLVVDIQIDPTTEILSITNKGSIPIEDVNIYPTIYITKSPEDFASSSTKVFFFNQALASASRLGMNESKNLNLDNSSFFIFYDRNNNLTKASAADIASSPSVIPHFFETYGSNTIATENNIYYCFRISFRNSFTKEEEVRYILITAQEGANWFNSVPTNASSGSNESGSYSAIQTQLQIKDMIFKQQQLEWNDSDNEYYNAF